MRLAAAILLSASMLFGMIYFAPKERVATDDCDERARMTLDVKCLVKFERKGGNGESLPFGR